MSVISLTEEIHCRQSKAVGEREMAQLQNGHTEDIVFLVIQEIFQDYSDVVQAISLGTKEPAVLERLAARIIAERGYTIDYCRGPEEERDAKHPEGDVWLFEVTYLETEYYVKLKIEDGMGKCLAFHESEHWLGHPYR